MLVFMAVVAAEAQEQKVETHLLLPLVTEEMAYSLL
jgi:hypothetical protein